ncbi:DUF924 family protein [Methyloceanibacter caenitepidi]|uniref:Putative transmembrane protein n=1 Tax=Methyloceanibacter caenitepidi TaxID=1384459 RepID=A0A0A8K8G0_9HYPH|nr:DUF924 family protein [Methyloceanibacter caenitepidi]BAQ18812.1 putative transmembrane protein [Methyloceanibacter caenitepidi]
MTQVHPGEVVRYWFETLSPDDWYGAPPEVDAEIARRFGPLYESLRHAVPDAWLQTPQGRLAAVLVLDQFPRNIHRGTPQAFATDDEALALSKDAIAAGADMELPPEQRAFLYMPFQHAENLEDQRRSLELFKALGNPNNLDFAVRHYEIIARFGRFPHRNDVLGRASTPEERAFLNEPGSSF